MQAACGTEPDAAGQRLPACDKIIGLLNNGKIKLLDLVSNCSLT